jgi:hypothetical protein
VFGAWAFDAFTFVTRMFDAYVIALAKKPSGIPCYFIMT